MAKSQTYVPSHTWSSSVTRTLYNLPRKTTSNSKSRPNSWLALNSRDRQLSILIRPASPEETTNVTKRQKPTLTMTTACKPTQGLKNLIIIELGQQWLVWNQWSPLLSQSLSRVIRADANKKKICLNAWLILRNLRNADCLSRSCWFSNIKSGFFSFQTFFSTCLSCLNQLLMGVIKNFHLFLMSRLWWWLKWALVSHTSNRLSL